MREVLMLAVLMSGATMTWADNAGPKDTDPKTVLPEPEKEEEFTPVTFPRRLPDGKVTVILRTPNGTLQRVVYDRVKHPIAPGDTIRQTPFKATEADVRAEPKSSEPMKNAKKKIQQLIEEMMRVAPSPSDK